METLKIALAQINPTVGDLRGNLQRIVVFARRAREAGALLALFPELALSGYPPEDLLLNPLFVRECRAALEEAARRCDGIDVVVGFPEEAGGRVHNAAALLRDGRVAGISRKTELPNYGVFDEHRYFTPGAGPLVAAAAGVGCLITICEDIWVAGGAVEQSARASRPVLVLNLSASPFHAGKLAERHAAAARFALAAGAPVCYANLVGGQDELVFDGGSFVMAADGRIAAAAKRFDEDLLLVEFAPRPGGTIGPAAAAAVSPDLDRLGEIHAALVLGTRDYLGKNRFTKAVIGLSGGIDSALTAALAVEALGADRVIGVSMPSRFNSGETRGDAARVAENFGIRFLEIPIQGVYEGYLALLADPFDNGEPGVAGENLQARVRGNILMALSNRFGWLVLTTGNKSETAVGYCTLYGDMAGGFAVIKDVPKTLVWELAANVNRRAGRELIPESTIARVPSAELRPNQRDEDSLPPYPVLDAILAAYIEELRSPEEIAGLGFDPRTVERVIRLVDGSEYKRRQAPPGVKLTPRAFGRDRRLPITNRWTGHLVVAGTNREKGTDLFSREVRKGNRPDRGGKSLPCSLRVLVIMHVESEGPGVFGGLLQAAGAKVRVARLHQGDALPEPAEFDAVFSMGGPMNVYEEQQYPFLRDETRFLQAAAARDLPVLGICLGAQMIAKAAGAAVTKNPIEEVGWSSVSLSREGLSDPLFRGLPPVLPVFQWHGDTFGIPAGGTLLATGSECHNQAFRFRHSYGLQFHLEADRPLLAAWFAGKEDGTEILRRSDELAAAVDGHVRTLFANFLEIARRQR